MIETDAETRTEAATRCRTAAVVSLVGIAAVWGLSFPTMKAALQVVSAFGLLSLRTLVGFAALAAIWSGHLGRDGRRAVSDPRTLSIGASLGLLLAAGLALQVKGLETTTATKAGFITGLYVVFTPFLAAALARQALRAGMLAAAILATAGLFLLTVGDIKELGSPVLGDVLNLFAAAAFALHVTLTAIFAPKLDFRVLCVVEAAAKAVVFLPWVRGVSIEQLIETPVWVAVLVTGIGATALGLAVQTWAQRYIPAAPTAIVLASEPAFAGLFGFLLLAERLSGRGALGALAMLVAILWAARLTDGLSPSRTGTER